ncbi:MAG: hypothetical protein IJL83_01105 [Clostridia bacterium]|nr:hypothetical protein [Clostridia bacterium]
MGLFFSNFHVRKTEGFDADGFQSLLLKLMKKQGFKRKKESAEADLSVSIYDAGGKWLSVCSDGIDFYMDESVKNICEPLSEELAADVLTVSCFDSDCLIMNRINRSEGVDAFAKIGSCPGLKRRSAPSRWKGLVDDVSQWKAVLSGEYTFAEDALAEVEPLLGLETGQGRFCSELLEKGAEGVRTLYYALPEAVTKADLPYFVFSCFFPKLLPCEIGKRHIVTAANYGSKSKGIAIVFSGNYVERDEIRFRDVQFICDFQHSHQRVIRLEPEKRQDRNGRWVYYAEIPDFSLQKAIPLPISVNSEFFEEQFGVSFTPEGNKRKVLDITVHFIPLKNPEGQCAWCVWRYHGSKRAFIENHNKTLANAPGGKTLDINDYDDDE